jgi:hypothetical protein
MILMETFCPRIQSTSPRVRGEVGSPLAMRSIVQRDPGEGDSPRVSISSFSWRLPLTLTLSPQAGRGDNRARL